MIQTPNGLPNMCPNPLLLTVKIIIRCLLDYLESIESNWYLVPLLQGMKAQRQGYKEAPLSSDLPGMYSLINSSFFLPLFSFGFPIYSMSFPWAFMECLMTGCVLNKYVIKFASLLKLSKVMICPFTLAPHVTESYQFVSVCQ